jgi:hypothetical protein
LADGLTPYCGAVSSFGLVIQRYASGKSPQFRQHEQEQLALKEACTGM